MLGLLLESTGGQHAIKYILGETSANNIDKAILRQAFYVDYVHHALPSRI